MGSAGGAAGPFGVLWGPDVMLGLDPRVTVLVDYQAHSANSASVKAIPT